MKRLMVAAVVLALASGFAAAEEKIAATMYKNPGCMCCDSYANYLRANGFNVTVVEHPNMTLIKQKYGVREDLEGCHSTVIGKYVVEGHVPVAPIKRLLDEKPDIKGIRCPACQRVHLECLEPKKAPLKFYPSPVVTVRRRSTPRSHSNDVRRHERHDVGNGDRWGPHPRRPRSKHCSTGQIPGFSELRRLGIRSCIGADH